MPRTHAGPPVPPADPPAGGLHRSDGRPATLGMTVQPMPWWRSAWTRLGAAATATFTTATVLTVVIGGLGTGPDDDPAVLAAAPVPPVSAPIVVPERAAPERATVSEPPARTATAPPRAAVAEDGADGTDAGPAREEDGDRSAARGRARRAVAADAAEGARDAAADLRAQIRDRRDR